MADDQKQRDEKKTPEGAKGEKKKHPEDEAVEQSKNRKGPPRDENTGPEPPPGMDAPVKDKGKSQGQAPLPRDQIGGRG